MRRASKKEIKIDYQLVDLEPEEIERRLDRAFAVVFEEVMRIRGSPSKRSRAGPREVITSQ